jgi:metallo-beta-lactamase family protein
LNYLEEYIDKPETTVILVDYQVKELGESKLIEGAVNVKSMENIFCVASDRNQSCRLIWRSRPLNWLSDLKSKPSKVFGFMKINLQMSFA